jgi:Zn-dependent protease with chaperone function
MIFPGAGKIVVSSALLESFSADEEIAATLAHEVTYLLASLCYSR